MNLKTPRQPICALQYFFIHGKSSSQYITVLSQIFLSSQRPTFIASCLIWSVGCLLGWLNTQNGQRLRYILFKARDSASSEYLQTKEVLQAAVVNAGLKSVNQRAVCCGNANKLNYTRTHTVKSCFKTATPTFCRNVNIQAYSVQAVCI